MTARERRLRVARRLQSCSYARVPKVCPVGAHALAEHSHANACVLFPS
jgi:hypothetical protein